jgi:hypothetical protein
MHTVHPHFLVKYVCIADRRRRTSPLGHILQGVGWVSNSTVHLYKFIYTYMYCTCIYTAASGLRLHRLRLTTAPYLRFGILLYSTLHQAGQRVFWDSLQNTLQGGGTIRIKIFDCITRSLPPPLYWAITAGGVTCDKC